MPATIRLGASGPPIQVLVPGDLPPGAVTSVFGRVGAVLAALGDYTSSQVTNLSGVPGATVTLALDALAAAIAAIPPPAVSSVFGRVGAVLAAAGDYTSSQITNLSTTAPGATVTAALDGLGARPPIAPLSFLSVTPGATENDYDPPGWGTASGLIVDSAATTFTGFRAPVAGEVAVKYILAAPGALMVFSPFDGGSAAANQIAAGSANVAVANRGAVMAYTGATWAVFAGPLI